MRIVTWNVNGLRAAMGKGFMEWIENEQPDVVCLQEVRARSHQLDEAQLKRLEAIYPSITWHPAQRPGYSGVAVFARQQPLGINIGLGAPIYDSEGRVIIARYPGFLLFNIYFPNGGHDLSRVPFKLDFYAYLLDYCNRLHARGEQIIITGDFNTAHRAIDLKHPKENAGVSGFLPEERLWIDRYLENGFIDAYRQLYPDRVGYTWWTYRMNARKNGVGWRLDYYLVSQAVMGLVKDVVIHDDVVGSDHCPVSLLVSDGIK